MGRVLRPIALFLVIAGLMIGLFAMGLSSLSHNEAEHTREAREQTK